MAKESARANSAHQAVCRRILRLTAIDLPRGTLANRYSIYVVQLRSRCPRCKARRKPGMRCCVYVGSTGRTPEERLAQHLAPPAHIKATVVTQCGGTLRRDLAPRRRFASRAEAVRAEAELAAELERRGYTVFGGRPRCRADGRSTV